MNEHIPIPQGFTPIPKAANNYVVSDAGFVFNLKTGRLLKQHWNGHSTYTIIRNAEGRQYRFSYEKMLKGDYTPLTREWVLDSDGAKIIPEYPDYAVSHYGAVYRIVPRKTGPRAGEVFMLSEYSKQGHAYVKLCKEGEKNPREARIDQLTEQLWGGDSTYQY
jgi:hypothetical protein